MVAIADIPKERLRAIRQAYRRVCKRRWAKEHYVPKEKKEDSRQGGLANVRLKEERPTVEYCQGIGCGKKLTKKRYNFHYCSRECYIGTFHKVYHHE
jgi:hypothetical protein